MSKNIEGKVVVTSGATVVRGARRVERIESLAGELTGRGGRALAVATDVTLSQPEDVDINEILYRPTRQELWRTADGGAHWTEVRLR